MRRSIWGNSIIVPGAIQSSGTAGIGYAAGAGGAVTQITSKATGVTIDKICGTITMHDAQLNAGTVVSFIVTNACFAATDLVLITHDSVATLGSYTMSCNTGTAGTFTISLRNVTAGNLSEAIVLRFAIIKAVIT